MPPTIPVADRRRPELTQALVERPLTWNPIAMLILPATDVQRPSAVYTRMQVKEFAKRHRVKRQKGSNYNRVSHELTDDYYKCIERGLEEAVDSDQLSIYDNIADYKEILAERSRNATLLDLEIEVAAALINETTFPLSGSTGHTATDNLLDPSAATVDPRIEFNLAFEGIDARCGLQPDVAVMSPKMFRALWANEYIKPNYQVGSPFPNPNWNDPNARKALAMAIGVEDVLVGNQRYNSANDGQAVSIAKVWSDDYIGFAVRPKSRDIQEAGLGRIFACNGGDHGGQGVVEEYYSDESRSDVVRFRMDTAVKIHMTECFYLLKTGS